MEVTPELQELIDKVDAKRARVVIDHIVKHGKISTEELKEIYGYNHPPRAARDVREWGVPLKTIKVRASDGRPIGAYVFDDPAKIRGGRIGGRKAFSKQFKADLIRLLGQRDTVTGQPVAQRYLQIDHRIPYEVAGDGANHNSLEEHMLLDASSQRAKSFSCENCRNMMELRDVQTCATCYWAYPESYTHVAMEDVRRADLEWRGDEAEVYQAFASKSKASGRTINAELKKALAEAVRR